MSTTTPIPTHVTPALRPRPPTDSRSGNAASSQPSWPRPPSPSWRRRRGLVRRQTGASIPIAGFAQLTLVFSLVGVAAVMVRKARRPRATFGRTTLALTVLSFVPDLISGFDAGSAATLIILHTTAGAIVVPTLAGRLARTH